MALSEHPLPILRMTWEGLYVALSRVRYRDHIRLIVKRDDWSTVKYVKKLRKCKYTDAFFSGYKQQSGGSMRWDYTLAKEKAVAVGGSKKSKKQTTLQAIKRRRKA